MPTAQSNDARARARLAFPEIVRVRWIAVAAGGALLAAAHRALPPDALPYPVLFAAIALTALSNAWLARRAGGARPEGIAALAFAADIVSLTIVLAASGGPHNPFALIYAIPVAMAAMVGGARGVWPLAALAAAGYAISFVWYRPAHFWHEAIALPHLGSVEVHLVGMWISIVVVSVFTTDFIQRLVKAMTGYERALREAERRLSHTERLAELTALAAGAAHELASPLGTVAIVARELERKAHRDGLEEHAVDATVIRDEIDRCREILGRMARAVRDGSALEAGTRSVADLWDLLSAELGDEIERVRLENELAGAAEPLPIPASQLAPLLLPLIRNALDAVGDGADAVEVLVHRDSDAICVDVCDRGAGMRADVLARAAEPLFTTKAERGGAGLGLYLVQVVCEALGGQLSLDSSAGGGTRASLSFRVSQVRA